MRDRDIRAVLRQRLLVEHEAEPDTRILDELGLCRGAVRVDVAVVNGYLTGFEIKSEQDTLTRLSRQVEIYSRVLDYAVIVTGAGHVKKVREAVPKWWGIEIATVRSGEVVLRKARQPKLNPRVDPLALAELLWREEALLALEERDAARGLRSKPRAAIAVALADLLSLDELSELVRTTLKCRVGWRSASEPTLGAVT